MMYATMWQFVRYTSNDVLNNVYYVTPVTCNTTRQLSSTELPKSLFGIYCIVLYLTGEKSNLVTEMATIWDTWQGSALHTHASTHAAHIITWLTIKCLTSGRFRVLVTALLS